MLHASLSHCWHKIGGDQVCASTTYQKGKLSLKTLQVDLTRTDQNLTCKETAIHCSLLLSISLFLFFGYWGYIFWWSYLRGAESQLPFSEVSQSPWIAAWCFHHKPASWLLFQAQLPFPRSAHLNLSLLKNSKQKTSDPYPDPALHSQCRSGEKSNRSMFAQCLLILSLWHLTAHLLQNINALTKKFVRYKITTEEDGKPKGKNEFCCTLTPKAPGAFGHTAAAQLYLQHTTFCHGNWPFSHSKKKSSVLSCTCKYFQHHLL